GPGPVPPRPSVLPPADSPREHPTIPRPPPPPCNIVRRGVAGPPECRATAIQSAAPFDMYFRETPAPDGDAPQWRHQSPLDPIGPVPHPALSWRPWRLGGSSFLPQQPAGPQPVLAIPRPVRTVPDVRPYPPTVAAAGVDVQLRVHAGALQRQVEHDAVL